MPGQLHDAFVDVLRYEPRLAGDLLRAALESASAPRFTEARVLDPTLTQVVLHADLAVRLEAEGGPLAVAVEVQLQPDEGKRYSWPLYAWALRSRLRCPACVLVVAPDRATAAWARRGVEGGPGLFMRPLVAGPDVLPHVTDPAEARAHPELALLSVLAWGRSARAESVARAAAHALKVVPPERREKYYSLARRAVAKALWDAVEEQMPIDYEKLAKEDRARFLRKARAKERAEGRAEGRAFALIELLNERKLPVSDAQRERIQSCRDEKLLGLWLRRAVSAPSVEAMFGEGE